VRAFGTTHDGPSSNTPKLHRWTFFCLLVYHFHYFAAAATTSIVIMIAIEPIKSTATSRPKRGLGDIYTLKSCLFKLLDPYRKSVALRAWPRQLWTKDLRPIAMIINDRHSISGWTPDHASVFVWTCLG
jgi:hypothetical protein